MTNELTLIFARLARLIEPRLRGDPELCAIVSGLASTVATWAAKVGNETVPANDSSPVANAVATIDSTESPGVSPSSFPDQFDAHCSSDTIPLPVAKLPPLRFGTATPIPSHFSGIENERELPLIPLTIVAERCRVKSDACRLIASRFVKPDLARNSETEKNLQQRASLLPECNLWMLNRDPIVTSPKAWEDLAGALGTAAEAALLLNAWEQSPAPIAEKHASRVLGLAAEAQSVLLYAVADIRDVKVDYDQVQLFANVRTTARNRQVFIPKYLKRDDRAAPESWPDVARRIAEAATFVRSVGDRDRQRAKSFNNLKFKINRLRERPEESSGEWPRIIEIVDEMVAMGLPPSNPELRELLLPLIEEIPDDPAPTPNVGLVLREIDRYLDHQPEEAPPPQPFRPSALVAEAAELLRGREVVLIGGHQRPIHKAALIRAFGLADLRWLSYPEHTSFTVFEPDIARPEVAIILLAIRWSNHDYDSVREYSEEYGKPLVRLPGGYNPNQVAHHILDQAGDRLRSTKAVAI